MNSAKTFICTSATKNRIFALYLGMNYPITSADSAGIIESGGGAISLAKLLQSIRTETRARIIGVTSPSMHGVITTVIAGGLAEVQHAIEQVKGFAGVNDSVFFAKPDLEAIQLVLRSLNLVVDSTPKVAETKKVSNVRSIAELDVTELETWNVHELRRYARSVEHFPLHGRAISKANRPELLRYLQPTIFPITGSPRAYPAQEMMPS